MKITLESYRYGEEVGILFTGYADEEGNHSFTGTAASLVDAFNEALEMLAMQTEFAEKCKQDNK